MPRPVHFELLADDLKRAAAFYENVFDWKFQEWGGPQSYWLITTGEKEAPGIDGGMMKRCDAAKFPPTTNVLEVPDLDAYLTKVTGHGGKVIIPRNPVAGVGWVAYCSDTEGNIFGIIQFDSQAK